MTCKWKTVPLGDVLELVIDHRGKTPKKMGFEDFHDSGYPVLSAKHVKTSGLAHVDTIRYANQEMYDKWMKVPVEKGDVVLTSEAPMGETFYIDGSVQYLLGQRVFGLRPKEKIIEPLYLQAWLSSGLGQSKLQARATGSTVQGIKQSELLKIDIELPPLSVQRVIARNQFNFSKKIELNQNINQTLEQIAQALFKSWFVDFEPVKAKIEVLEAGGSEEEALLAAMQVISSKNAQELVAFEVEKPEEYAELRATAELFPSAMVDSELGEIPEGWEVKPFSDWVTVTKGKSITKARAAPGDIPVVAGGREPAYYHNEFNVEGPAITISASGANAGYVNLYHQNIWSSDSSYINKQVTSYFYTAYTCLKYKQKAIFDMQTGAAQPHIYPRDFERLYVVIANESLLKIFERLLISYFEYSFSLVKESVSLTSLRDTLLPKLLSGELSVESLNEEKELESANE